MRFRLVVSIAFCLLGAARVSAADRPTPDLHAGQAAYERSCARCHGMQGRGDGLDAKRFYPRPRDLTLGVYKFRSTASGTPPTDDDLFDTMTHGLPGSNMPDWQHLDEATRWQLVYYLKSLAPIFEQTKPEPVQTAPDPGRKGVDLAQGRALYEKLGCAACHGAQGRANGTSAGGIVDDWGKPIRPANLTRGWAYRGQADARAVMLRVLTGIDGAGMPSYAGALSPEEAWQLAYYVTSLQEPPHWYFMARPAKIGGPLPTTVDDARWAEVEFTDVRLRNVVNAHGEWVDPPTIAALRFQVVLNDEAVAIRVTWDDPTLDESSDAPDALALVLRPEGVAGDVVSLQAWPYAGAPALDFCYWSASRRDAHEVVAMNVERVMTAAPEQATSVLSQASYHEGRWQLVLQRPRRPTEPSAAAQWVPGELIPIAFTVWDGGNPHARAVSPWVDVRTQ